MERDAQGGTYQIPDMCLPVLFGLHTGKGTCIYQHWTIKPKRRESTENTVNVIVPIPGEIGTGSVYRPSVYIITTLYDV